MVSNILPVDPPPDPGGGGKKVELQLVRNMVMLHIKLKGITNAATWLQVCCPRPPSHPPDPGVGSKGQKSTISEHGHVAYQHIFCLYTQPRFLGWSQRSKHFFRK